MIDIQNLTVEYRTKNGLLTAIDGVDLTIRENEIICVVGESGCGKTTLTKSILGLLPNNGEIIEGEILYNGTDVSGWSESEYKDIRWSEISYIIQNAMNALNPVKRVGAQFQEVIRTHTDKSRKQASADARELLEKVGIDGSRLRDYPHEFSGGQRQRLVIALALALRPPVVIADEPTTGLDVVVQDEILELLTKLQSELENTVIVVTHDMSVVSEIADRVVVMYGGRVAEVGTCREVFKESAHPYTIGLINAFPSLQLKEEALISIPGSPPDLLAPPEGCRFRSRCPFATDKCVRKPAMNQAAPGHDARCHYVDNAAEFREQSRNPETWENGR